MNPPAEQNGHHHPREIELPDQPVVLPEIELPDDPPAPPTGGALTAEREPRGASFRDEPGHPNDVAYDRPAASRSSTNEILKALSDAGFEISLFQASGKNG